MLLAVLHQQEDGPAQQEQEGGQANDARLVHDLDELVVDISGLIVEALHRGELALYSAQTPAVNGALAPQLQAVPEEHQTLDKVLIGPQRLETVGGKAGQQGVAQGHLGAVGEDDPVQSTRDSSGTVKEA